MMKLRDKSLKVFRLSRKDEDWNVYKQLRNSIKSSLRTAESNYAQKQIDTYKGDPRSMWKVIREFVPSKDSEKPVYQKDHKILANEFNEYFASVAKATADKVKNHSMETLNIATTDLLLEAMDNKQLSIVIFLDMSKTFDSVRHDMLLQRISNLGA